MTVEATPPDHLPRWFQLDLAIEGIIVVLTLVVTAFPFPLAFRLPFVAALVLFVPGYALLCALITHDGPSIFERVAISIAASIAMTILIGLLLAALGLPIERLSWAVSLSAISLVVLAVAWIRRVREGIEGPHPRFAVTHWRQVAVVGVTGLIVANIIAANGFIAEDQFGLPPAQLWLLPGTDDYTARVGFTTDSSDRYRLIVTSGSDTVEEFDPPPLTPGQSYEATLQLTPEQRTHPVIARLYVGNAVEAERMVVLQPLPSVVP